MFKILKLFFGIFTIDFAPRNIMVVYYDIPSDKFSVNDWVSKKINCFSGQNKDGFFLSMKEYSLTNSSSGAVTRIYIHDGEKYIAYNEKITHYFDNPQLLKTGRGFVYPKRENENTIMARKKDKSKSKLANDWFLISEVSSGKSKSIEYTEAMYCSGGILVKVTIEYMDMDGCVVACSNALQFLSKGRIVSFGDRYRLYEH